MNNEKTGNLIAEMRKQANLTQAQLAERICVSDKAVSRWETGRGFPDINSLEALADELGISEAELIRGERISDTVTKEQLNDVSHESHQLMKDYLKTNRIRAVLCGFLLAMIIIVSATVHLFAPRYLPYEESTVRVEQLADGRILALISEEASGYEINRVESADSGRSEVFISVYRTLWDNISGKKNAQAVILGGAQDVDDVYYYPSADADRLLYSRPGSGEGASYPISLPRLIYNYWLVLALVLTAAGLVVWALTRRKWYAKLMLKVAAVPAALLAAIPLQLIGHFTEVYNAAYYFSGIILTAAAIWLIMYQLIDKAYDKKRREGVTEQ
jgi:transcriptional regulator with XRE-family HTH domain